MAAIGQVVSVGTTATLIFEVIDRYTYDTLTSPAENVFCAGDPTDLIPLLVVIPSGATVYLGGSGVTSSSTTEGCPIVGPSTIAFNSWASDSLYGVVASSTATVGLLCMRQSVAGNA
jgi:hypothetical protein